MIMCVFSGITARFSREPIFVFVRDSKTPHKKTIEAREYKWPSRRTTRRTTSRTRRTGTVRENVEDLFSFLSVFRFFLTRVRARVVEA